MASEKIRSALPSARVRLTGLGTFLPGLLICVTIALASTFISDHYGGPTLLYALLFGMAFNFLSEEGGRSMAGVEFSARTVLRFGVALLGMRITVEEITSLGVGPVLTVIIGVTTTIIAGVLLAKALRVERDLGLLTGGAVAICGASAALALSAVMPRHEHAERNTILTVVGVTTLSTMAMVLYPLLVRVLGLADADAGVFLGGTIHDVAQVVGAGYLISPEAGEVSTFIKLMRVAMLVPAVLCFTLLFRGRIGGGRSGGLMLPGFLVAFVLLVLVNSLGLVPAALGTAANDLSRWCLVTAIAALGIKTSLQKLAVVGWRPVALMVGETLFLAALVLGAILAIGVS